jgi:transcription initiation factor IIE alpha subunit
LKTENSKTERRVLRIKQIHMYTLDLTKMEGSGDFSCPRCGTSISPDDCTEEAYSVLEAKVNDQGLEELIIRCNKCASQLHLTGFSLLQKLPDIDGEALES